MSKRQAETNPHEVYANITPKVCRFFVLSHRRHAIC